MKTCSEIVNKLMKEIKFFDWKTNALSFFIPEKIGDVILENAFVYTSNPHTEKTRPYARISVISEYGQLVSFQNCYLYDFIDTQKYPFEKKINYHVPVALTVKEQMSMIQKFSEVYGKLREFAFHSEISKEEETIIKEYSVLFTKIIPKDLYVYYYALSPQFFCWMKQCSSEMNLLDLCIICKEENDDRS